MPHLNPELLFFLFVSVMPAAMIFRSESGRHLGIGQVQIIFGCLLLSFGWAVDYSFHTMTEVADTPASVAVPHLLLVLFGYVPGVCLVGFGSITSTRELTGLKHEIERRQAAEAELVAMNEKLSEAARHAEQANKAKSDFLANMSHDLRTPLNAIMGFSELMHAETFGKLGADRYKDYLDAINSSSKQLHDNISDILDFTKAKSGQMRLRREPVDLRALVRECVAMSRGAAETKHISFSTIISADMVVVADRRMLTQVLLNLLSNAIKLSPDYGKVSLVMSQQSDGRPVMTVKDSGAGMQEADIALATSPFEVSDSLVARSHEGAALQLALVNKFIELHDGQLQIDSKQGVGTSITVKLPPIKQTAKNKRRKPAKVGATAYSGC